MAHAGRVDRVGREGHHALRRIGLADVLGDGFYAGAVGAAVVALFFLVMDSLARDPFYTPSLVGSVIFEGVKPSGAVPIDLTMVALFSLVHGGAFVLFGTVFDAALSRLKETPDLPLIAIVCFVLLTLGVLAAGRLLAPGLAELIGYGPIVAANALAAIGMSIWLKVFALHRDDEPGD